MAYKDKRTQKGDLATTTLDQFFSHNRSKLHSLFGQKETIEYKKLRIERQTIHIVEETISKYCTFQQLTVRGTINMLNQSVVLTKLLQRSNLEILKTFFD